MLKLWIKIMKTRYLLLSYRYTVVIKYKTEYYVHNIMLSMYMQLNYKSLASKVAETVYLERTVISHATVPMNQRFVTRTQGTVNLDARLDSVVLDVNVFFYFYLLWKKDKIRSGRCNNMACNRLHKQTPKQTNTQTNTQTDTHILPNIGNT